MERKLASCQIVNDIIPIVGADRVELCNVLGWYSIVLKNQFSKGELIVFLEIDSVVPPTEVFVFMKDRHYRVRTMKSPRLNVISQGLVMSLSILPKGKYEEGQDVTEILGIQKYEAPIQDGRRTCPKGLYPTHLIPKTDEQRIESMPQLLEELKGLPYIITVKLDGTSCTIFYHEEFGVCSRNLELRPDGTDVYWAMARKYNLDIKLKEYCEVTGQRLAIQGEICGKLIANNPLGLLNDDLFVFSIYDITNRKYLNYDVTINIARDLGLKFVPLEERGDCFNYTVPQLEEKAIGTYPSGKKREGIVIRPAESIYTISLGNQLSFKTISKEYLLEEK